MCEEMRAHSSQNTKHTSGMRGSVKTEYSRTVNTIARTHYNCSSLKINHLHAGLTQTMTYRNIRVFVSQTGRRKTRTKTVGVNNSLDIPGPCLAIKLTAAMCDVFTRFPRPCDGTVGPVRVEINTGIALVQTGARGGAKTEQKFIFIE